MKRSYHADDRVYQRLRESGKASWDQQANPEADFETFVMRPFLEEALESLSGSPQGLSALEIGCGSGPVCCFLAERGLTVRGIDVSPTALEMARREATARGLGVRFDLADICHYPEQPDRYDLIIDGHCLHCIVHDEDRGEALGAVRRLLRPGGLYLLETMIAHPDLVVAGKYRIDARGVLSIAAEEPGGVEGEFQEDGQWFTPHRRLLTQEQVASELRDAGFEIRHQQASAQADSRKPMLMQIRASLAPSESH